MAAVALIVGGVLAGGCARMAASSPIQAETSGQAPATVSASSAGTSSPRAGGASTASAAAQTARALAYAQAAASAAAQASLTAQQVQSLVATARSAYAQVQSLATQALARKPSATDPRGALAPLTTAAAGATSAISAVQQAVDAATTAAAGATRIAARDPDAQQAASDAATAVQGAQAARSGVEGAASEISSWTRQAQTAISAWEQVHNAPPGYFGMEFTAPPGDWTVQGCEVITANPGSPAAQAGLVGRDQRFDPVGDVITSIADASDANSTWPVPNCSALQNAIAKTRAGDAVTIDYYHRQVILLFGKWVAASGSTVLTNGSNPSCPPAMTGAITSELTDNRIRLSVQLTGAGGVNKSFPAILDTGAGVTTFPDAYLRAVGYRPFASGAETGVVPGAQTTAYLYRIPGGALRVDDRGAYVPVATGTLIVTGIPGGTVSLLGPDVLKHGTKFSTSGSRWTLTLPCS